MPVDVNHNMQYAIWRYNRTVLQYIKTIKIKNHATRYCTRYPNSYIVTFVADYVCIPWYFFDQQLLTPAVSPLYIERASESEHIKNANASLASINKNHEARTRHLRRNSGHCCCHVYWKQTNICCQVSECWICGCWRNGVPTTHGGKSR